MTAQRRRGATRLAIAMLLGVVLLAGCGRYGPPKRPRRPPAEQPAAPAADDEERAREEDGEEGRAR